MNSILTLLLVFNTSTLVFAASKAEMMQRYGVETPARSISPGDCEEGLEAYRQTLYPLVRNHCATCHGDNGAYVRFAQEE